MTAQIPEPAILQDCWQISARWCWARYFPPQYEIICRLTEANPQLPYSYIDQHVLSVSREVHAATLFELWDLPDEICGAVRFQQISNYTGAHQSYVRLQMLTRELLTLGQHGLNETHYERAEALGLKKPTLLR